MNASTVTIEKTGKIWKAAKLISVVILFGGIALLIFGQTPRSEWMQVLGVLSAMFGAVSLVISKIGAWWFHG